MNQDRYCRKLQAHSRFQPGLTLMDAVDDHTGKLRCFLRQIQIEVKYCPRFVLIAAEFAQPLVIKHPATLRTLIERVLIKSGLIKGIKEVNFLIERQITKLVMPPADQAAAARTVQKLQCVAELQLPPFLLLRNRQHAVRFRGKE